MMVQRFLLAARTQKPPFADSSETEVEKGPIVCSCSPAQGRVGCSGKGQEEEWSSVIPVKARPESHGISKFPVT